MYKNGGAKHGGKVELADQTELNGSKRGRTLQESTLAHYLQCTQCHEFGEASFFCSSPSPVLAPASPEEILSPRSLKTIYAKHEPKVVREDTWHEPMSGERPRI